VGLAFLAAAYAKLDTSGVEWITGGAVRYHFVEDAGYAPMQWGLAVASSDSAAIGVSLAGFATEALFWLVICSRREWIRFAFGLSGLALLAGFYLFMGVLWRGWWILFLAFLPWGAIESWLGVWFKDAATARRSLPAAISPTLSRPAVAVIGLLVVQQIVVSAMRFESEPFVSDFPMYSHTWPSREAFNDHLRQRTRQYVFSTGRLAPDEVGRRLGQLPTGTDVIVKAVDPGASGQSVSDATKAALATLSKEYELLYSERLTTLHVATRERAFDWSRGAFLEEVSTKASGTLNLDTGVFQPADREQPPDR
jgi:hypothetical protein